MSKETTSALSPALRFLLSLLGPIAGGILLILLVAGPAATNAERLTVLFLAGAGVASWLIGMRWYGLPGLGLRGGRPLYASIGFAVLGWLAFLVTRLVPVANTGFAGEALGRVFVYLLLFEAFCVQLWAYGLLFRAMADWRGPLSAVLAGGVLFATIGLLLFEEAQPVRTGSGAVLLLGMMLFFFWGFFYGIIRLRTGSLVGTVIVQAFQSLTVWHLFTPQFPSAANLRWFYTLILVVLLILIWRLWPRLESDYRI